MEMDSTYFGYNPDKIKVGDIVVSYPHHRTRARLHGDVIDINPVANKIMVNYNRSEDIDGEMKSCGVGVMELKLKTGTPADASFSTSLDIELFLRTIPE